jgi:hypothetical protein
MNVLDENIIADQREQLRRWRIPFRQIGYELASSGTSDAQIIPLLLQLKHPTFFTRDFDFFEPAFCHPNYCIAWLNVRPDEAALYIRRVLRHPRFTTQKQRLGNVIRVHPQGISLYKRLERELTQVPWSA